MTQSLADMRREYTRDGLSEANAPSDPFSLFRQWFDDAVKTERLPVEPNAMTLATVDADGYPHCRILLLKGLDERGFTFFTNYESAKGRQLAANPRAAMTFFWPALERQVRIEGSVEKVTPEESDAYYQVRPLGSRLGAWASPQSRVIADRAEPGTAARGNRAAFRRPAAELSRALGRLPSPAAAHRVLAGAAEPPARPSRLSTPGRRLVARTPGALSPPCSNWIRRWRSTSSIGRWRSCRTTSM